MRHIISILLQNEAGALARVANLFSSRGYNIESLNVAPTADETVSRLTLVTTGSETVIDQIEKQLGKVVDVVDIADMTKSDHIERELALFKLHVANGSRAKLTPIIEQFGARVLSDAGEQYTVELVGGSQDIDRFLKRTAQVADVITLVRSGAMAVMRGTAAFKRG
ncbi:MAG TPA: acetolactate synthase small subunit [Gammaproteobacteria bacterium]|nr:acetolactate synthase small subunit [Gammaproteobacteria bacterium]